MTKTSVFEMYNGSHPSDVNFSEGTIACAIGVDMPIALEAG
nr:hypothetical protein [Chroococcidiopsis cubana]